MRKKKIKKNIFTEDKRIKLQREKNRNKEK